MLFCRLEDSLYAYGAAARRARPTSSRAELAGRRSPVRTAARPTTSCRPAAPGSPELHLDPFPLLTRNGRTQVALPSLRAAAAPA